MQGHCVVVVVVVAVVVVVSMSDTDNVWDVLGVVVCARGFVGVVEETSAGVMELRSWLCWREWRPVLRCGERGGIVGAVRVSCDAVLVAIE